MPDAVVISTARTPIGRAYRGAFNDTHGAELGAHAVAAALSKSSLEPGEIDDLLFGCGMPEGTTGFNIARQIAIRAGLPVTVAAGTVSRFCASGLEAIANAAARIKSGDASAVVAGGVESISLVQNENQNAYRAQDEWILREKPALYMSMLETAEIVARRYGVGRDAQDEYALASQQRTAAAQANGVFKGEIVPITATKIVVDKATGERKSEQVTLSQDEANRPQTTIEGLNALLPVMDGGVVTAGNASQLSDGASACVIVSAALARRKNLEPLGLFRGFAVAGCEPDEMGIGPVLAVPKLLERTGVRADDIDLWELNEAFASQVIYCRDLLGIPMDRLNVNGGAISIGHPYGMTGARMVGHALLEGRRRGARYVVVTMCMAAGMGAAALFETV